MFEPIAPMILMGTVAAAMCSTVAIVLTNELRRKGPISIVAAFGAGAITYVISFSAEYILVLLHTHIGIIQILFEEIIKFCLVALAMRWSRPMSVIASFAAFEAVGKYLFMYLTASPARHLAMDHYVLYVCLGISGAYVMHIATSIAYINGKFVRGLSIAILVHIIYNESAIHLDEFATFGSGIVLISLAALLVILVHYFNMLFEPSLQRTSATLLNE